MTTMRISLFGPAGSTNLAGKAGRRWIQPSQAAATASAMTDRQAGMSRTAATIARLWRWRRRPSAVIACQTAIERSPMPRVRDPKTAAARATGSRRGRTVSNAAARVSEQTVCRTEDPEPVAAQKDGDADRSQRHGRSGGPQRGV